jgi:hypothetical protein
MRKMWTNGEWVPGYFEAGDNEARDELAGCSALAGDTAVNPYVLLSSEFSLSAWN